MNQNIKGICFTVVGGCCWGMSGVMGKYLFDAITYLLSEEGENSQVSINQYLLSKHKRPTSTINRAMQNAIVRAWRVTAIEDLEKLYTAHINYNTGVPTPVEFIYYYVDKIKKEI